jgi:hypothetical protein
MKHLVCVIFALISGSAVAAVSPGFDLKEACPGYSAHSQDESFERVRARGYELLIEQGFDMANICGKDKVTPKDSGVGLQSPVRLPVNMMAQFYAVPESRVSAHILVQTAQTATVLATAPGGKRCTFELIKAPSGVKAPSGWLTDAPDCVVRGGGGIPITDGAALEQMKKAAALQENINK